MNKFETEAVITALSEYEAFDIILDKEYLAPERGITIFYKINGTVFPFWTKYIIGMSFDNVIDLFKKELEEETKDFKHIFFPKPDEQPTKFSDLINSLNIIFYRIDEVVENEFLGFINHSLDIRAKELYETECDALKTYLTLWKETYVDKLLKSVQQPS